MEFYLSYLMQLGILEEVCWDIELESEKLKTQGFGIERERIIEWKKKMLREVWGRRRDRSGAWGLW